MAPTKQINFAPMAFRRGLGYDEVSGAPRRLPPSFRYFSRGVPMPQAVVDPEELRQFAQSLKKFNNGLREQAGVLASRLAALSATWRDQEHKKFAEQFETNMKVLVRFTETADQYVPYLLRKAEHIEDYLQK